MGWVREALEEAGGGRVGETLNHKAIGGYYPSTGRVGCVE